MTPMKRLLGLVLLAALLAGGCSATAGRSQRLLERNYQTMSDATLMDYYRQLNDQLARVERAKGGEEQAGGAVDQLFRRRNAVRSELSRRELRP